MRSLIGCGLLLGAASAAPAWGQVSGSVGIESDYRLRGYSLSEGYPVAMLALGYDHPSGAYLGGAATLRLGDGLGLLGYQASLGYATRIGQDLSIDAGILRSQYTDHYRGGRSAHYTEGYVGLAARGIAARLSFSPDYFEPGKETLYGEVEGSVQPAPQWRLSARIGVLRYFGTPREFYRRTHYDWRLAVSRRFGRLDLHAGVEGGGPGDDYYRGRDRGSTAVTAGAAFSF